MWRHRSRRYCDQGPNSNFEETAAAVPKIQGAIQVHKAIEFKSRPRSKHPSPRDEEPPTKRHLQPKSEATKPDAAHHHHTTPSPPPPASQTHSQPSSPNSPAPSPPSPSTSPPTPPGAQRPAPHTPLRTQARAAAQRPRSCPRVAGS